MVNKRTFYLAIFTFLIVSGSFFVPNFKLNTSSLSISFSLSTNYIYAETVDEREARLRAELAQTEKEIKANEAILSTTKQQSASLARDITILNAQIKLAQLNIKAKNIAIEQLGKDITAKTKHIGTLEDRLERGKDSVAQIMRKSYQLGSYSLAEIMLEDDSIAEFFANLDEYEQVQKSMYDLFADIRDTKDTVEVERTDLGKKKNKETDARVVIEEQKKIVEKKGKEKAVLLADTKGQEAAYETLLAVKRKKAGEIRAALFSLRDTDAIPFAKAFEYATLVSQKTGVRPAYILAILTQESALGKNVGSCYLSDPTTGAGISAKSGTTFANVMAPGGTYSKRNDVAYFVNITKELGKDPYKTLVSCPIPSAGGWGGAMGPAQFIPSTWMMFRDKVAKALGVNSADPWRPADAFMASGIYLSELGAGTGGYTAEWNAACRYYSGRACKVGDVNSSYGTQVLQKAYNIQENMINLIQGV
ncbi:MAG: lytic murein transglycosylase [bacterium]|nr:lytic murein transglycosylase [bacterium]